MPHSSTPFSVAAAIAYAFQNGTPEIARIYTALGISLARVPSMTLASGNHGFIAHELRGYRGADWCFSLVLNQGWIRLYVRAPELGRARIGAEGFFLNFPPATRTSKGEIALNISDEALAGRVCDWFETLE